MSKVSQRFDIESIRFTLKAAACAGFVLGMIFGMVALAVIQELV